MMLMGKLLIKLMLSVEWDAVCLLSVITGSWRKTSLELNIITKTKNKSYLLE